MSVLHTTISYVASTHAAATPAAPAPVSPAAALNAAGEAASRGQVLLERYGLAALQALVLLIIGFIIAGWVGGFVRRTCERAKLDITLGRFLSSLVRWALLAAFVIMCLSSFGVEVTSFVALLGTIGIAIGLALQGSLSHIAAGIMLLIFRPFKVGDFVTAGGQTGIVDEISLFSTFMVTPDNRRIIVPNGAIVAAVITNSTAYDTRVAEILVQADPGATIDRQREVLREAAMTVPGRDPAKQPGVALTAMGAANTWSVSLWCKTAELDAVKERLLIACTSAIAQANLVPPASVTLVKHV